MPTTRPARGLPLGKKLIYAAIPTLLLLGGLEIVAAWLGVEPLIDERDPYVGFSRSVSLMERVQGPNDQVLMVTRPSKTVWFNEQVFARKKPAGTKRVFCLGGSTTYGRPYTDLTSYCGWLREYLPLVDPAFDWEVINAGGVSYASYRVANVMQELVDFEPDLFVIYTAHNEFLEKRTYRGLASQPATWLAFQGWASRSRLVSAVVQTIEAANPPAPPLPAESSQVANDRAQRVASLLPGEVDERLNHTIGPVDYQRDPQWREDVLTHYAANLRRMVRMARSAGADIVFLTPASNLKDCSPFKSLPGELKPKPQQEFEQLATDIMPLIRSGRLKGARELLQAAAELDPKNADIQFWLGHALFDAGFTEEAEQAFRRALNEDVCPLRAVDEIVETIRSIAAEYHVPFIDFERLLRSKCLEDYGHTCLGKDYFLDHVHPTIEVHEQLARWIIGDLQELGFVSGTSLDDPVLNAQLSRVRQERLSKIDREDHGVALRNLAKVLHWAGKFSEAAPRARDAIEWLGNDAESRFVLADCLKNMSQPEEACQQYETLFEEYPDYSRAFLPYGELLTEMGAGEKALGYLLSAAACEPDNAYVHYTLGRYHLRQGEFEFAVESLSEAARLQPGDSATSRLLAEAEAAVQAVSLSASDKRQHQGGDPATE